MENRKYKKVSIIIEIVDGKINDLKLVFSLPHDVFLFVCFELCSLLCREFGTFILLSEDLGLDHHVKQYRDKAEMPHGSGLTASLFTRLKINKITFPTEEVRFLHGSVSDF